MTRYMKDRVIPQFVTWVNGIQEEVQLEEAMQMGREFIKSTVDVNSIKNRGELYDAFEELKSYAKLSLHLREQGSALVYTNMQTLAQGVIWAVQHDGFDSVKYLPLSAWGVDIQNAK